MRPEGEEPVIDRGAEFRDLGEANLARSYQGAIAGADGNGLLPGFEKDGTGLDDDKGVLVEVKQAIGDETRRRVAME